MYIVPSIVTCLTFAKSLLLTTIKPTYLRVLIYLEGILLVLPTSYLPYLTYNPYTRFIYLTPYTKEKSLSLSLYTFRKIPQRYIALLLYLSFSFPLSLSLFVIIRAKNKARNSKSKRKSKKCRVPISQEIYRFRRPDCVYLLLSPKLYLWIPS